MFRTLLSIVALSALVIAQPGRIAAQGPGGSQTPEAKADSGPVVNLNTATVRDLETLPGVGEKTAERIIEYRQKNGSFKKIEDLMNVQGIGEKVFLKLRARLTVAPPKSDR